MKKNNTSKQDNKSLQKFTKFESLKTKEQFLELKTLKPKIFLEVEDWIYTKVTEAQVKREKIDYYLNKLEALTEAKEPEKLENFKRQRYQTNRLLIETAIHNKLLEADRLPTHSEIAQSSGISRTTVSKHLSEGAGHEYNREIAETHKILSSKILNKLYIIGMNGDVKALKVYLDYIKDKDQTSAIRQQNNYIQINNTKIDEATINQLTPETRIEIEKLIINATR